MKSFTPVLTTGRVQTEQFSTAPPHTQAAFRRGVTDGWIQLVAPANQADIDRIHLEVPGLSATDAELFVLADAGDEDLFTDEDLLARYATKHEVTVYDVVDTIMLLEGLGKIDVNAKKRLVLSINAEDGRTFTRPELDALGLPGFI